MATSLQWHRLTHEAYKSQVIPGFSKYRNGTDSCPKLRNTGWPCQLDLGRSTSTSLHWRAPELKYRREIDGLRALAVLPVILFHAGFEAFSGGFVGVDVFFVISGYLITSILINDLDHNRFSVLRFYERRARRILPALFFMMLACIPFAWFWMLPNEMETFAGSFFAVSVFISNFFFWREGNYFGHVAEQQPLLHTWSLAVEEQFYLLFPIFLLLAWRLGRGKVFWLVGFLGLLSLLLSQWATYEFPVPGFYLAPTRAWELIAGSIAAFLATKRIRPSGPLVYLGLAAVILPIFIYDSSTPFPGFYAVPPVLGAFLIILFAGEESIATRILGSKLLVGIGLISYSAYLWHQPLFAFARIRLDQPPNAGVMILLCASTLLIAFLSYRFVESPFRRSRRLNTRAILSFSLAGSLALASLGIFGVTGDGFRLRFEPVIGKLQYQSLGDRLEVQGSYCEEVVDPRFAQLQLCESGFPNSDKIIVAYGDSHLKALGYRLDALAMERGLRVIHARVRGCGVIPGITSDNPTPPGYFSECSAGFRQLLDFVNLTKSDVLIVSRWTFQMFPAPGYVDELNFDNGVGGIEDDLGYRRNVTLSENGEPSIAWANKREAMVEMLEGFASTGAQVFVNYPIPEVGWDIFKENLKAYRETGGLVSELKYPTETYYERNGPVIGVLAEIEGKFQNVEAVRADLAFCSEIIPGYCVAQTGGTIYYLDDDHLSDAGADLVLTRIPEFR